MPPLTFEIDATCETTAARTGTVTTTHGSFATPAFMPVGTQGTVKGLLPAQVRETGAEIILGNTYHLMLRPGADLIAGQGGLPAWSRWQGPMLTDSGGFQVFSLADTSEINEDGVTFKSHLDGEVIELTPERSMQVQNHLGADIIMAFDDCPPAPADPEGESGRHAVDPADYDQRLAEANQRTLRWLDRCIEAHGRPDEQALFGIVQGGVDLEARTQCTSDVTARDLPGYAIGGVAVGEGYDALREVVEHTAPRLPADKPRYLMGVGYERDLVTAVRAGMDMFDCVLPTRNGRNANAFTPTGQLRLRNAQFTDDDGPIDPTCDCVACGGGFSRSYLRHLFKADEMLGPILVQLHNLHHFQRLMLDIRRAIRDNAWSLLFERWPVARLDPADT
ncbi:MAG: tRNA guanosine(34) transglycosylase Tgt [Phycisphaeraceae bacterium]|nr:tRNA guanosine(34) transglycosylase Tgt [Phycisphaeraceae bacterium]